VLSTGPRILYMTGRRVPHNANLVFEIEEAVIDRCRRKGTTMEPVSFEKK